ncbi:Com family DNA-binding transcriptional regulator [Clostridium perfringens]|nr:Com family DNA-binding transcriptional regulator [Clostridium perfringens]MCX0390653.1 Com family DNA-binding transcriptional regulator [Clostridium perfringens]MDK0754714.1 Com family DNA-binding transcriptional regulator [Clostridium perfringens]MDK0757937.1 Com family DNA-binding transcriptional regulator [Clostridium perfringens]MDM0830953.1 Com family DNA-binding transcriptional regulator [Clostridium perfringens]
MVNIKEIRCPNCNQLLLKANFVKGEIKCNRCKKIIILNIKKDRA